MDDGPGHVLSEAANASDVRLHARSVSSRLAERPMTQPAVQELSRSTRAIRQAFWLPPPYRISVKSVDSTSKGPGSSPRTRFRVTFRLGENLSDSEREIVRRSDRSHLLSSPRRRLWLTTSPVISSRSGLMRPLHSEWIKFRGALPLRQISGGEMPDSRTWVRTVFHVLERRVRHRTTAWPDHDSTTRQLCTDSNGTCSVPWR